MKIQKGSAAAVAGILTLVGGTQAYAQAADTSASHEAVNTDIIVSARRIDERLQDVPISITVFNQTQLDDRNITNGGDLATYTPSLTANNRFGSNNSSFSIRGFTQELRTTPSVGVYFAEVVAPRGGLTGIVSGDGAGPGNYFDLQNVQVLKGPQGTLFGRNTTGGAILLVPRKPTDRFEGYVEGSVGNYDMKRIQAVLNVPISDTGAFRIGVDRMKRDGFLRNISGIGPDRKADRDYVAVRASLLANLTPELENYTVASYSRADETGAIPAFTSCVNSFPFGLLSCQQFARQQGQDFYTVQNDEAHPVSFVEQWQVINKTTWQVSDAVSLRNIASYAQFQNQSRGNTFGTDWIIPSAFGPIPNTGPLAGQRPVFALSAPPTASGRAGGSQTLLPRAQQWTATEELQLVGTTGTLDWQIGGYLELSDSLGFSGSQSPLLIACQNPSELRCFDVFGALLQRPGLGSIGYAITKGKFRNVGVYGQATYKLAENFKLTGGLRYTWDKVWAENYSTTIRFFTPNTPTQFCTFPGVGPGTTVPVQGWSSCGVRSSNSSQAPTWVVGLDYNPADDVLLYAKYSRGYRQGSVNPFAPPPFQNYDEEKVDTYEIGLKASFRGSVSGNFGIAAFYNDFSDQQLAVAIQSSTNAATPTQAIVNAGSSRIQGFETDASVTFFDSLTFSGSFAYLDTRISSIALPAPTGGVYDILIPVVAQGAELPFTPKYKGTLTASYRLPLPESVGDVTISGTYTYASSYLTQAIPRITLPSVELLNFNLNWNSVAGLPIDISAFVVNAANEKYFVGVFDQPTQGFRAHALGEPRTYGLRVKYRFGS